MVAGGNQRDGGRRGLAGNRPCAEHLPVRVGLVGRRSTRVHRRSWPNRPPRRAPNAADRRAVAVCCRRRHVGTVCGKPNDRAVPRRAPRPRCGSPARDPSEPLGHRRAAPRRHPLPRTPDQPSTRPWPARLLPRRRVGCRYRRPLPGIVLEPELRRPCGCARVPRCADHEAPGPRPGAGAARRARAGRIRLTGRDQRRGRRLARRLGATRHADTGPGLHVLRGARRRLFGTVRLGVVRADQRLRDSGPRGLRSDRRPLRDLRGLLGTVAAVADLRDRLPDRAVHARRFGAPGRRGSRVRPQRVPLDPGRAGRRRGGGVGRRSHCCEGAGAATRPVPGAVPCSAGVRVDRVHAVRFREPGRSRRVAVHRGVRRHGERHLTERRRG